MLCVHKAPLAKPRVIAVDVDGTLHRAGEPNTRLIAWLIERKSEGFSLTLWSARGEQHARNMAERCGCVGLFDHIVSKPGYVVDDRGWSWIKWTEVVRFSSNPTETGDYDEYDSPGKESLENDSTEVPEARPSILRASNSASNVQQG